MISPTRRMAAAWLEAAARAVLEVRDEQVPALMRAAEERLREAQAIERARHAGPPEEPLG